MREVRRVRKVRKVRSVREVVSTWKGGKGAEVCCSCFLERVRFPDSEGRMPSVGIGWKPMLLGVDITALTNTW